MKCADVSKQLVELVCERLSEEQRARFLGHVQTCPECRKAMDGTAWLRDGVRAHGPEIRAGHLAPRLLFDFIEKPDKLEPETLDQVQKHLSECATCRGDLESMQELCGMSFDTDETLPSKVIPLSNAKAHPVRRKAAGSLRRFGANRRGTRPWFLAAAVLLLVLSWGVWQQQHSGPAPLSWSAGNPASRQAESPLESVQLPVRMITRGESAAEGLPNIQQTSMIELDTAFLETNRYRLHLIEDERGLIWEADIPKQQLATGRLSLRIEPERLGSGDYRLRIVEMRSDGITLPVAETAFTVP